MADQKKSFRSLRQHALEIFRAALSAVDPAEAISRHVKLADDVLQIGSHRFASRDFDRVFVIGAGKAGGSMGQALEKLLGDHITDGVVVTKDGHVVPLTHIRLHQASPRNA